MVVVEDVDTLTPIAPSTGWMRRAWLRGWWIYDGIIGIIALVAGLAFVAALPIVQFASFGYLLESAGRIVREQRLAAGLTGVRAAARLGTIALCGWLLMLPLRAVATLAQSAQLVDPGGKADAGWSFGLLVLTALVVVHFCSACARGGRVRNFLWPAPVRTLKLGLSFLTGGSAYSAARDAVYNAIVSLRPGYFFWLGFRGFLTGLVWLLIPVTLLATGRRFPALGFLGGLLLTIVVLYLPFLQTRFAAENRWRAMFEVCAVRRLFMRAPGAFLMALLTTLALSLPLNLLKIELVPREAAWLPSLMFVAMGLPSRWVTGWAVARAERHTSPRSRLSRWLARALTLPVAAAYVLIVYFTQYTSWYGIGSLYEQHAFMLPVPFLGY